MLKTRSSYVGLYGSVALKKGFCKKCQGFAFVIDGKLRCCDEAYIDDPKRYRRESEAEPRKRRPPKEYAEAQLKEQGNRCFWCGIEFGRRILRRGTPIKTELAWDHMIPFTYSNDNRTRNFVASCHVCNSIKGSLIFKTIEECRTYVYLKRQEKGYL